MSRSSATLRCVLALTLAIGPTGAVAQDESTGTIAESPGSVHGSAFPIEVVFTNIPGHPTAQVPGHAGIEFGPGTGTTHFDRPYGSPNGNWLIVADTTYPTAEDEVVMVNGAVGVREGTPAAWTGGAETVGLLDQQVRINDAASWVFATNTNGPLAADEYIVSVSGGTFTAAAKEGQPVPGIAGATWGATLDSPLITSGGTVGFSSDTLLGVPATQDDVLVLGATILGREGVTVPSGQLGSEFWDNFNLSEYWTSADGSAWLVGGDLTGATATDEVVVVNGAVVVQEGVVLPGSGFPNPVDAAGIVGVHMDPGGNWYVRGNNDVTEQDWIYRNGAVLATLGQPVYTGSAEVWEDAEFADCFFLHVGNSAGHHVIGGVSDGPTASNGVIVLDGTYEVVRESDFVDLDGDGLPGDNAFFNTFGNDDGWLTDSGDYYFTATIKNGAGTVIGQGFFVADLSSVLEPCSISCPANVTAPNDPGACSAVVAFDPPVVGGACGTVTCDPASGSQFPVGVTAVTCSTAAGPACAFDVTVEDAEPPVLGACPDDIVQELPPGSSGTTLDFAEPSVADNCPGATVACAPPSGSFFPIGSTQVVCSASDAAGNPASCSFLVALVELAIQEIPTLSGVGLALLSLLLGGVAYRRLRRKS